MYNFEGSSLQSWVNTNQAQLTGLSFTQFLLEFRKKFLPPTWQDNLIATQISMQSVKPFLMGTEAVHEANAELGIAKSSYFIEEDKLCTHFVPRLSPALKASYGTSNTHLDLDKITDLNEWVKRIHLLDVELKNKQAEWLKIVIEGCQTTAKARGILCNSTAVNSGMPSYTTTPAPSTTALAGTSTPRLTQAKHNLLKAHHGCFRCCIFYTEHVTPDCLLGPKECPSPEACKNVTLTNALKAKAAFKKRQGTGAMMIAASEESEESDVVLGKDETNEYIHPISHSLNIYGGLVASMPLLPVCPPRSVH